MRLLSSLFRVVLLATLSAAGPLPAEAQVAPDSVSPAVRRAQRMVNDGNGVEGRALLDSILNASEPRSAAEAEALFWRATLAESWEAAERDYLRLMLEHDRSPVAGRAMLRLAQGEYARGDRDAALRYLERLATEAPESPARAEGGLWQGRLLIDRGARDEGCLVLRLTRPRVAAGALELENQYDYLLRSCPDRAVVAAPAVADTTAATRPPPPDPVPVSVPTTPPPTTPPPAAPAPPTPPVSSPSTGSPSGMAWSVQVAAFGTMAEASDFATALRARGYDTRVDGTAAPFRVRFGRYPTRAAADAAMRDYRSRERADAFLAQVPRG